MWLKLPLFVSAIFLVVTQHPAIGKLSSSYEIEEHANHVAQNLDRLVEDVFSLLPTLKFDENVLDLCDQMGIELAHGFQVLNEVASSDPCLNKKAAEAMEYLNDVAVEILNCPAVYSVIAQCPQARISSFLRPYNIFMIKRRRDRDRDVDENGYELKGGIKGKWGDGKGVQWEAYVGGRVHDDKGNYVEGRVRQKDNGIGDVDVHGGHEEKKR
jgi:hypothetical protein